VEPGCNNCHDKDPHVYVKGAIKVKPVPGYGFEIDVVGLNKNLRYVIGAELVDSAGNIIARKFHTLQLPITLKAEKPGRYLCYVGGRYNNYDLMYDSAYADALLGNSLEISSISSNPVCSGDSLYVDYKATGNINSGTVFIAQLSDDEGKFNAPVTEIGRTTGKAEGTIPCYIPFQKTPSVNYKIRVIGTFADISVTIDSIRIKQGIMTELEGAAEIVTDMEYEYRVKSGNRNQFVWIVNGGNIVWQNKDNNIIRVSWEKPDGSVCVTETNDVMCSDNDCLFVSAPTSVTHTKAEILLSIYPNPAYDYIEINIPPLERGLGDVSVFDVIGVEVLKGMDSRFRGNDILVSSEGNVRIDISSLSPGVYFVSVGGKMYKFVKM